MLFNNKKQWGTDTHWSMDGPQKHDNKWKKLDMKDYVLYDSVHVKCPENIYICRHRVNSWLSPKDGEKDKRVQWKSVWREVLKRDGDSRCATQQIDWKSGTRSLSLQKMHSMQMMPQETCF